MTERKLEERKLDGRTVYDGRILRLEVDRVRVPGGGESVREVVRHQGASVMIPVADDGRLLFVRQFRYPTGEVLLELPAGKLEPGEDPAECAERETAEEVGFRPGRVEKLGEFFSGPGFTDELIRVYLVTDLRPQPDAVADPDEILEVVPLTPGEFWAMVERGDIRDGKTLAAVALWERMWRPDQGGER